MPVSFIKHLIPFWRRRVSVPWFSSYTLPQTPECDVEPESVQRCSLLVQRDTCCWIKIIPVRS